MRIKNQEKGQAIVLIVISMVGLIAMAALIIDGGNAYLKRRNAQTAADAGALAGVYELCVNKGSDTDIYNAVYKYAVTENGATKLADPDPLLTIDPNPSIDRVTSEVKVVVEVTTQTFFAKVFGQSETTVVAKAAAGCFPPGAVDSVIPVAWSCRPPLPGMPSDSEDCEWKAIPFSVMEVIDNMQNAGTIDMTGSTGTLLYFDDDDPDDPTDYFENELDHNEYLDQDAPDESLQIYLIMDGLPLSDDVMCSTDVDGTTEYCDLDGDGRIDWTNSERSWLLLDPNSNDAQLDDIVRGELVFGMTTPGWYPGRGGGITDVYKDADDFVEGEFALIPVFEEGMICPGYEDPSDPTNPCPKYDFTLNPNDYVMLPSGGDPETYFRVIGFAEFFVSCVSDKPSKKCPGKQAVIDYLNSNGQASAARDYENEMSIEGYFVDGWVAANPQIAVGSNAIDLGIYVLSLIE